MKRTVCFLLSMIFLIGSIPSAYAAEQSSNLDIPDVLQLENIDTSNFSQRLYDEEDLNTIAFSNLDGSITIYIFDEAVKYVADDGSIHDKGIQLCADSTMGAFSGYHTTENNIQSSFPASLSDQLPITTSNGEYSIAVVPQLKSYDNRLSLSTVSVINEDAVDNSLIYQGVWDSDTAIKYMPLLNGYKEEIVLNHIPTENRYSFLVDAGSLSASVENDCVVFSDATNEVIAEMSPIFIYDSSPTPVTTMNSYYECDKLENGQYMITIVADDDYLRSSDITYPVYVDPTLTFSTNTSTQDAMIYSGTPSTANGGNYYHFIGYYDSTYKIGRLLVKFPGLTGNTTYKNLSPWQIRNITYYAYCDGTNGTANIRPYIYTGNTWTEDSVTYNSASWNSYVGLGTMSQVSVSSAGNIGFDITAAVKLWKSGTYDADKGLLFKNVNETSASYCKTFTSTEYGAKYGTHMPYIEMTYVPYDSTLMAINDTDGAVRNTYFTSVKNYITANRGSSVYTSTYSSITASSMITRLQSTALFMVHTHGSKTTIKIGPSSSLSMTNLASTDLSTLDFALLLTCKGGEGGYSSTRVANKLPVNMVERMVCCGATTVVGFSDNTFVSDCNKFAVDFAAKAISQGYTVQNAIDSINYSDYILDMSSIAVIGGNTSLKLK